MILNSLACAKRFCGAFDRFSIHLYVMKLLHGALLAAFLFNSVAAEAGYFEIFVNGSYFKFNNGTFNGETATTTTSKYGGGMAYRLLSNTSIELNYTHSKNLESFAAVIPSIANPVSVQRTSQFDNLSLNLVLEFMDKKSAFRPYVRGGGGYMYRQTALAGSTISVSTGLREDVDLGGSQPDSKSVSADAGLGFKVFIAESIAVELSTTVYATDLDQPKIYLHYSVAGGLRYIF
jgi:hypothetical protein